MKKTSFLLALCITMMIFLTSCNSVAGSGIFTVNEVAFDQTQESVPDAVVQVVVDECLDRWGFDDFVSYETEIRHDPDAANHMDTVTITFRFEYPYGYYITELKGLTYQYDRASDLWNVISKGKKGGPSVEWKDLERLCGFYEDLLDSYNRYYYSLTINSIDTKNLTASVSGEWIYVERYSGDPYNGYIDDVYMVTEVSTPSDDEYDHIDEKVAKEDRALLIIDIPEAYEEDSITGITIIISLKRGVVITFPIAPTYNRDLDWNYNNSNM